MTKLIEIWEKVKKNSNLKKIKDIKSIYYKLAFNDGSLITTTDEFKNIVNNTFSKNKIDQLISNNKNNKNNKNKYVNYFIEIINILQRNKFKLSPLKFIEIAYFLGKFKNCDIVNDDVTFIEKFCIESKIYDPKYYIIDDTLNYFIMDDDYEISNDEKMNSKYYKEYIKYKLMYLKFKN